MKYQNNLDSESIVMEEALFAIKPLGMESTSTDSLKSLGIIVLHCFIIHSFTKEALIISFLFMDKCLELLEAILIFFVFNSIKYFHFHLKNQYLCHPLFIYYLTLAFLHFQILKNRHFEFY
jgi:hypothetical protein